MIARELAQVPNAPFYSAPLTDEQRTAGINNFVANARAAISFPENASDLSLSPLYQKIADDSGGPTVDQNLAELMKKDLRGDPLTNDVTNIKRIAASPNFQRGAAALITDAKLKTFNLAALGADMLSEPNSTVGALLVINKTLGSPFEKTIANFKLKVLDNQVGVDGRDNAYAVFAPEDWVEVARNLANPAKTALRPGAFDFALAARGRQELDALLVELARYGSLDLLNSVTVPMGDFVVNWAKEAREKLLASVFRIRKLKAGKVSSPSVLANLQKSQADSIAFHQKLSSIKILGEFYLAYANYYKVEANKSVLTEANPSGTREISRALAVLRFSVSFNDLRKKHYKVQPSEGLAYLVYQSFDYLHARKKEQMKIVPLQNLAEKPSS